VTTEHHDHSAFIASRFSDRVDDLQEIASDENVGQRFQERGETAVLPRWRCEFTGGDFVWSSLDWDCLDLGEIDLLGRASRAARPALTA
jgi:hypothetical protein